MKRFATSASSLRSSTSERFSTVTGGSERGEDVSKLGRDVAAADDDHGSRQLGQPHHRVGGVEVHRAQAR